MTLESGTPNSSKGKRSVWLARGAVIGQVLFTSGWMLGGFVQEPAYSPARHDISELGAITARAPWVMLVPQGLGGALTLAFVIGALRPTLKVPGRRGPLSAWLVAFSLIGLDNLTDPIFRLPCRAIDPGCTGAVVTATFAGMMHLLIGMVTGSLTLVAPFALSRRMRLCSNWRDLASKTSVFGVALTILFVVYVGLNGAYGQGYAQRTMALLLAAGIVVLARRVDAMARSGASHECDGAPDEPGSDLRIEGRHA